MSTTTSSNFCLQLPGNLARWRSACRAVWWIMQEVLGLKDKRRSLNVKGAKVADGPNCCFQLASWNEPYNCQRSSHRLQELGWRRNQTTWKFYAVSKSGIYVFFPSAGSTLLPWTIRLHSPTDTYSGPCGHKSVLERDVQWRGKRKRECVHACVCVWPGGLFFS